MIVLEYSYAYLIQVVYSLSWLINHGNSNNLYLDGTLVTRLTHFLLLLHLILAIGGRDKNGGAIIILQGSPQQEYKTLDVGKVLAYLSRIPQ